MSLKHYLYMQLNKDRDHKLSWLNKVIIGVILGSFVLFIIETEDTIRNLIPEGFYVINVIIGGVFLLEYLCRLWVMGEDPSYQGIKGRVKYCLTPYALIDLVAIIPSLVFLGDTNTFWVRTIRLLRMIQLLKFSRYSKTIEILIGASQRVKKELLILLVLGLVLVLLGSMLLYYVEGRAQPEQFGSIPRSLWWAIMTLTTVGYGDVYPITPLGKVATSIIAIMGVGLIAMPAGLFAGAFIDELKKLK